MKKVKVEYRWCPLLPDYMDNEKAIKECKQCIMLAGCKYKEKFDDRKNTRV
jgi:hypothetical protein